MSWTEKKLLLPFMGADSRGTRGQEEATGNAGSLGREEPQVIRQASLRKFTSRNGVRKKWFVLFGPTTTEPARLEYWDNERKWRAKTPPKRSIVLQKCFNINRKLDTRDSRSKIVIAIYTLDDCMSVVFETENELSDWLDQLLTLQQGKSGNVDGKRPVPNYEHMWNVTVKAFTPEENNFTQVDHLKGPQRLCVTPNSVKFFPVGSDHCVEFPHACLRCCAHNDRHFKLETGRNSPSGSGALLIDCDHPEVSQYLHQTMVKAMENSKSKEHYLKSSGSRNRSLSLSEAQRAGGSQMPPPKSVPRNMERNRTISEPPWEGGGKPGQVTPEPGMKPPRPHSVRYGSYSTSPNTNPLSPTSPVGSVSAGLSSDGTGSSNSINDPYLGNGEHEHSNLNSYQPDVIPEESSGEISIEFNPKAEGGSSSSNIVNQTLPRCQPARLHHHQKQASLSDFSYDDYMDMGGPPPKPSNAAPPLPKRNNEQTSNSLSQLPNRSLPLGSNKELAGGSGKKDLGASSTEYHVMSPISTGPSPATPQISPTDGIYFDMDRLNLHESSTSTPLKSTSSITLVPAETFEATHLPARTPPVAIKTPSAPQTILTPPDGGGVKLRRPSGDGGYVIMSPGVSNNIGLESSIMEEPSSLAMLEESLGSSTGWRSSPRHASPSTRTREKSSRPNSKRNSSCLDEAEAHWPIWRYETEPLDCSTDDIYQPVNYPVRGARPTPGPMSRVSPASSSSAVSGTPSSDSRFTDFHMMEKVSSYLREDEDEEDRLSKRPPHGRKSVHTPKYMEIPSSKSSSRSNVSPFGRTPPTGASNSPTVASQLVGLFRHRAGSVPTRPPIFERRRHRTQSEGEKDATQDP